MHIGGQKSWRRVPKYRAIRTMATVPDNSTSNEEATVAGYAECHSDRDNVKAEEDTGSHQEAVIQRVEHIGKKSPRAFRVLADVMQNPQLHSKGGRMFLKQRQRMDKLAAEAGENQDNSRKKHTLPLQDENSRVSPWELASISPAAVQYITKRSSTAHGKRWSPFSPGHHLPQPPALWRSKVEKDFPPIGHRNWSGHTRTLSEGNYVGMYNSPNFPPGTTHFHARETSNSPHDVKRTSRFGHVERDFNARAKGWTKSLLD